MNATRLLLPLFTAAAVLAAALTLGGAALAAASDHSGRRSGHEEGHDGEHDDAREGAREGGDGPGGGEGRAAAPAGDPAAQALYAKECGSCHLAYPPSFLPAASHRRILAGLERHFGQNAELDPAARARLEGWLVANAAGGRGAPDGPLRITALPWFRREHRKIDAAVAARPAIRSMANCAACHATAARWDFDEDRVKIPR